MKENTFIVGIFGENYELNNLVGQALGAPDTKTDIQVYERFDAELGHTFTALTPNDYPNKIKPFLQILSIANIHILVIDLEKGLNAVIGEILVGLNIANQLYDSKTLIAISGITPKNLWKIEDLNKKLSAILKTTTLITPPILELRSKDGYDNLKKAIINTQIESIKVNPDKLKIIIDHVFPVKGMGTVILGFVKEGIVRTGQMVEIIGYDGPRKKLIIRSIQKHDRDFKEASKGDRVGIALKGNISPDDIGRNNVLVLPGTFKEEKEILTNIYISPFFKPKGGNIISGEEKQFHAIVDNKVSPFQIPEGEILKPEYNSNILIKFEKILNHDGSGLKGMIANLNRFDNKLRIVGWFSQYFK